MYERILARSTNQRLLRASSRRRRSSPLSAAAKCGSCMCGKAIPRDPRRQTRGPAGMPTPWSTQQSASWRASVSLRTPRLASTCQRLAVRPWRRAMDPRPNSAYQRVRGSMGARLDELLPECSAHAAFGGVKKSGIGRETHKRCSTIASGPRTSGQQGRRVGFSPEPPDGVRFLIRSRLLTDAEFEQRRGGPSMRPS